VPVEAAEVAGRAIRPGAITLPMAIAQEPCSSPAQPDGRRRRRLLGVVRAAMATWSSAAWEARSRSSRRCQKGISSSSSSA
ncbi:MAG TPA: hypothetical protein VFK86_17245, partial [Bauldia sp.]|nr:hypothetical protein [Bauldia sp.]